MYCEMESNETSEKVSKVLRVSKKVSSNKKEKALIAHY